MIDIPVISVSLSNYIGPVSKQYALSWYFPIQLSDLQDTKFLTGNKASVADAMTALELLPIMNWMATERYECWVNSEKYVNPAVL